MTPPLSFVGWGHALPAGRLTNHDLAALVDTTDEWIVARTGIHERAYARNGETTASLAAEAARHALDRAQLAPDEIDLVIVATCTPEQLMPHTGAFVDEALGRVGASFDLNAACSGFVYALVVGQAMLATGLDTVMVIGAETMSTVVDPLDRGTNILFGDGAGAAIIRATGDGGVLGWDLGGDGSAAAILGISAGGSRRPTTHDTVDARAHFVHMHGQEVFKRAVRAVVDSASVALQRSECTAADIDWFVPHQANQRIIESAAHRLGIPMERTVVNLDRYGNTSAASIPLALFEAVDDGRIQPGDRVLLSGFGAGMTWASAVLRWPTPTTEGVRP